MYSNPKPHFRGLGLEEQWIVGVSKVTEIPVQHPMVDIEDRLPLVTCQSFSF